ncbi:MAG: hypothetical protein D6715_02875 [Calditrichaeota bacterium]|nr:MAG: hypothetical protein D6715_02875 [Calditrichota bacterium]
MEIVENILGESMNTSRLFALLLVAGLGLIVGCSTDASPTGGTADRNLIANSSFEKNGQPTLENWFVEDTSKIQFVKDAPPGGGLWSVKLFADQPAPLPKSPAYPVPLPPGKHILAFSIYGKSKGIPGAALLVLKNGNNRQVVAFHSVTDSTWTRYALEDTLDLQPGDSLFVLLFGGGSEILFGETSFDRVELVEQEGN